MTKEQVYDEQIFPLMAKIVDICQENKIALIASFHTPNDEAADMLCTTALLKDQHDPPDIFNQMYRLLNPPTLFITKKDQKGRSISVTAVLP